MRTGVQEQLLAGRHARDGPVVPAVHAGAHLGVDAGPGVAAVHRTVRLATLMKTLIETSDRQLRCTVAAHATLVVLSFPMLCRMPHYFLDVPQALQRAPQHGVSVLQIALLERTDRRGGAGR